MTPRPTAATSLRVHAPAKVNLGLRVAALRGDGFHEIDTVFVTLDLADRLTLVLTEGADGIEGRTVAGIGLPAGTAPAMDAGNLAWRAAAAWRRATGSSYGVRIELEKHVPVAAGLGGGSSDAGAVLRGLARLAPRPGAGRGDLQAVATALGSDVPFFAAGLPAARGRGRGERLEELEVPVGHLVLANPRLAVSAGEAYGCLGAFGAPQPPEVTLAALRRGEPPAWRNDLQPGVMRRHPAVREAWTALRDLGLVSPLMSGSGATVFALARDEAHAASARAELAGARPDWWTAAARFPATPDELAPESIEAE